MTQLIEQYEQMTLSERISLLQSDFNNVVENTSEKEINNFLLAIIRAPNGNSYLKKVAIERLMELLFLEKLKPRHGLTALLDDWEGKETSLNVARLKSLYYLYDADPQEIESLYGVYIKSDEAELNAEASFHLGLINMQKGLLATDKISALNALEKSRASFLSASEIIENRVDASILAKVVSLTVDVINRATEHLQTELREIASLLFTLEQFSFNFKQGPFYIGFYRALVSLCSISNQDPKSWLYFRNDFSLLFYKYAEIQNQQIKNRLALSSLSTYFHEALNNSFFEPFFTLNFSSEKSRIAARLLELPENSPEATFINNVLRLTEESQKKKVTIDISTSEIRKIYPLVSENTIQGLLKKHDHLDDEQKILSVVSTLSKPSSTILHDTLLRICLLLQSNRLYYGNFSEDDRNTFIASNLESAGYLVKDQTRRSTTLTGKSAGEIDIFLEDSSQNPIAIIEALNLSSVDKAYIATHIDKIFTYDANGLKNNYVIAYSNAVDFGRFYHGYRALVKSHGFKHPFVSITENLLPYTELKSFTIVHNRSGEHVNMHHIVINLYKITES